MKRGGRPSHLDELLSLLGSPVKGEQFCTAHALLRDHLVHTREVPNGRDFLFAGSPEELLVALREIVEIEHSRPSVLRFDFAQVDQYFLLRITGTGEVLPDIQSYFEETNQL